jgi:hypothetical protein
LLLDFKQITAFVPLSRDDSNKVYFRKTPHFLSKISLCLNTPCRDNLPFRRRSNSYGGTSKRAGFSEELILPYHFDFRTIQKSFAIRLNQQPDHS